MAKKQKRIKKYETDSEYMLKLVLYLILGSIWLKITTSKGQTPIPVGFLTGLLFARHEHFRMDKKIEYAVLLVAMLIGFWLPIGVFISL